MNANEKKAFLLVSYLLQYPHESWHEALDEVLEEAELLKDECYGKAIMCFLRYARKVKELDLEEIYTNTFDFKKETNLYLTYYNFKEQRVRGSALLKLKKTYAEAGFVMEEKELPDFLPVMLEFVAASQRKDILKDYITVLEDVFDNLSKENNPYAYVLKAVLLLSGINEDKVNTIEEFGKKSDYIAMGGAEV